MGYIILIALVIAMIFEIIKGGISRTISICFLSVVLFLVILVTAYLNMNVKSTDGLRYDGIEDSLKYKAIIKKAGEEADQELLSKGYKKRMGYCHIYWQTKKRILFNEYHILWRSPSELNPGVIFD